MLQELPVLKGWEEIVFLLRVSVFPSPFVKYSKCSPWGVVEGLVFAAGTWLGMLVWLCHPGDSTFSGKLLLARRLMTVLWTEVWGWGCCHQLTDKEIVYYTKNTPWSSQATVNVTWCHVQQEWNKSWGGLSVAWPHCEDVLGCCSLFIPWDFSSFFRSSYSQKCAAISCLLHVWPQPLFTAGSKHCSELSVALPAPSVSCLKFVFDALAASPRAADMGRGESYLMGRAEGLRM